MANGWSEFGNALAGGGAARQQQAYEQGATGVARVQGLLAQARIERDKDLARSSLSNNLTATGIDAPTADLISSALRGGFDPKQISGYQQQAQETGIQRGALDRVNAGSSIHDVNPMLAVLAGKPVETSRIEDHTLLNPYGDSATQPLRTDEFGTALIGNDTLKAQASAASSYASANNSNASAARNRAGIGADKASNYELVDTDTGLVRVNKLTGEAAPVAAGDDQIVRALKGGKAGSGGSAGGGRPPNNEQVNAAGFANRMVAATGELDNLTNNGYDPGNARDRTAAAIGGYLGNVTTSDKGQQFHQAATNWVRANLRKESGAAIGKDEMDQEIENYFPKAGDSQETIAQKARNRALVTQNMIAAAGPAWKGPVSAAAPATVANTPGAASAATVTGAHAVGDIVTVAGKQYRVAGGDPTDPDLEPL